MDTTGDCILSHKKGAYVVMFRLRFISFTFLIVTTFSLGCNIINKGENKLVNKEEKRLVKKLDPVLLTEDDFPSMRGTSTSIDPEIGTFTPEVSVITGLKQRWSGDLSIEYWLFDTADTAKKVANSGVHHISAVPMNWQPEPNPEDVIGDATWHHIPGRQWKYVRTHIVFVKSNVLVHISTGEPSQNQRHQLQFARDIARKVEAKIETVLEKK